MWSGLFTAVVAVAAAIFPNQQISPGSEISQCNEIECPRYDITFVNEEYEIRQYGSTKWVGTSEDMLISEPSEPFAMMSKLSRYFTGENNRKQTISRTLPVPVLSQPYNETSMNVTIYFYIPEASQTDSPEPIESGVYLQAATGYSYYVRAFGGVGTPETFAENFEQLKASIGDVNKYQPGIYVSAAYYPDWLPWHYRNEVWLVAK